VISFYELDTAFQQVISVLQSMVVSRKSISFMLSLLALNYGPILSKQLVALEIHPFLMAPA